MASHLVSQNERHFEDGIELRPVSIGEVKIGVTDTTRFDLDKHFTRSGLRVRGAFNRKRPFELVQYRCLHGGCKALPAL